MNDLKIKVYDELKKVSNLTLRHIRQQYNTNEKCNLSKSHGIIVSFIYSKIKNGETVYQKDIEKNFSIRRSTATESLKRLEEQGYITRQVSKIDARLKDIKLTKKALSNLEKIEGQIIAMEEVLGEGITHEELIAFHSILKKIENNLNKQELLNEKNNKKS